MKSTKPSQRDIALAAGVSQATVSFVLTNSSAKNGISPETRRRVEEAASTLGYSPNVAAQSLRGGRTGLIGVHTYERIFPVSPDHYYHPFLIGLEEEASSLGVDLVLFTSAQKSNGARSVYHEGHNRMRLTDGAVILGARKDDQDLHRLSEEGFPIVSIGRPGPSRTSVASVAADYRTVVAETVTELASSGHERTLYVGHRERLTARQNRHDGYVSGCEANALRATPPSLIDPALIDGEWLTAVVNAGVTAVLAETTAHAQAIFSAAAVAHILVPTELSLVCLDVSSNPGSFVPWSHITVPRYELGRRSLQLLNDLLDGRITSDHTETLSCGAPLLTTIAPAHG